MNKSDLIFDLLLVFIISFNFSLKLAQKFALAGFFQAFKSISKSVLNFISNTCKILFYCSFIGGLTILAEGIVGISSSGAVSLGNFFKDSFTIMLVSVQFGSNLVFNDVDKLLKSAIMDASIAILLIIINSNVQARADLGENLTETFKLADKFGNFFSD